MYENPGVSVIYPEKGNSYNLVVEPGSFKIVVIRLAVKDVWYGENLNSHYDPSVNVELIKKEVEEYEGEIDDEELM